MGKALFTCLLFARVMAVQYCISRLAGIRFMAALVFLHGLYHIIFFNGQVAGIHMLISPVHGE